MLKVWGQPLGYHKGIINEATPLHSSSDTLDKVLLEMGLPITDDLVKWNF